MRSTKTGPKTRAVTDTPARSHPGGVTSANIRSTPAAGVRAPAVHRRALATTCGAPAMACCALAMNRVEVLRVRGCLTGAVRIAHESAKVESVVVRNFTPALPRLMQRDNVVEILASGVRQQMRFLQAAPAETSRCSFGLQRFDGHSGCS
jgi:hypothetical protein